MRKEYRIWALALCMLLMLSACGGQTSSSSAAPAEPSSAAPAESSSSAAPVEQPSEEALVEYPVEGIGTFLLPEGFTVESGAYTEPLPIQYATFEKDGYYIQVNRAGPDAYEISEAALPADVEEYSTRKGVQDAVPEGTQFAYDSFGNYATQFIQEDGQPCYLVLLQGEGSFANIFLTAPEELFDPDTAALWLSGSQIL